MVADTQKRFKNLIEIEVVYIRLKNQYHFFEYLIKTYTNENDIVLDNCIGSGTTAIACINTGRNFIGFELDKHYCEPTSVYRKPLRKGGGRMKHLLNICNINGAEVEPSHSNKKQI